ncbi:hypothetical protein KKG77_04435 [bacterium]|nr:hypothetical protein [bacterium]
MNEVVNPYIMGMCEWHDDISGFDDIKNINFVFDKKLSFVILSIDTYNLGNEIYCYQVQSIKFVKGIQKEGLHLADLTPKQFDDLVYTLRNLFSFEDKGI